MAPARASCYLKDFIAAYRSTRPHISSLKLFSLFLSDSSTENLSTRVSALYLMKIRWHQLMNIDI